ncbi:NAD(P)H-hydrate dehydratase [Clostridium sp. CX1]|uniref:NAD(P)H-hydrate dehydratase n=1 Tax=Clostridium sp. CX1 TaxID=2978346 RepID=UPI0021BE23A4|nr:NAD(P)H-hydrate dehydratase [Clostridium sp. CX1]MCT8976433.1 NAD(P)H-hydrate dehydratase [Clostridium sp. CX1]
MKIATAEIMRNIDNYCINELKIPGIVLMENAALKVINNLDLNKFSSFCIVCAKGNNGGDGFAVARHLHILNKKVEVFLVGGKSGMTSDCKTNYDILKKIGVNIVKVDNIEDINELRDSVQRSEVTVDAIFGTGLSRNVEGIFDSVISIINENSNHVVAIDVPSGFDANTGKLLGNCIRANITVSFQLYKQGFLSYGTDELTGNIVIEDIGIPDIAVNKFHNNEFIMDEHMIRSNIKIRDKYSYKGDYGRILVVAGSKGYTGAAYICTQGAVRSGAGLVTLCCREEIQSMLSSKLTEAMTISISEKMKVQELIEKSDVIAMGPGMGKDETTLSLVKQVISSSEKSIVIDADGLNVLEDRVDILKDKKCNILITPHLGEMARLTGLSIDYIKENRLEVAKKFAQKNDVIVLLKGYNSIITDGKITVINPTGNSAMASGGMGDCLTGMIASLIGQGYKPMKAAYISAFIHGYCGEELSKKMFCVSASDILENMPVIFKKFAN